MSNGGRRRPLDARLEALAFAAMLAVTVSFPLYLLWRLAA